MATSTKQRSGVTTPNHAATITRNAGSKLQGIGRTVSHTKLDKHEYVQSMAIHIVLGSIFPAPAWQDQSCHDLYIAFP